MRMDYAFTDKGVSLEVGSAEVTTAGQDGYTHYV